jgi:hypothetical protein
MMDASGAGPFGQPGREVGDIGPDRGIFRAGEGLRAPFSRPLHGA